MTVAVPLDDLSFWVDSPDPHPCAPIRAPVGGRPMRADVVVVGAGYAGLSAAYHLARARPDLDLVVLESAVAGAGASGRNTGILRPGVGGTILDLLRRFDEDTARRLYAASVAAVDTVRALVANEAIECDLEDVPHVKIALTARQSAHLRAEHDALSRHGFAAEYIDSAPVPVPNCGGLRFPGSAQLNPALLVRGLKRAALRRGARIYEHTPVTAVHPGSPARLELSSGATLLAGRVVLATDAHTARLGLLAGQIIPLQTHVSVTTSLTPAQLEELGWADRCSYSDKRHVFDYCRLTRDDRLLFGGGRPVYRAARGDRRSGATDIAAPRVWSAQRSQLTRLFPRLPDLTVTQQWAGTLGMTLDRLPVIGELMPGVTVAGGWSGHGVHLAIANGALVADLVLGRANPDAQLPWGRRRAPRVPPDPARGVGLRTYLGALQWVDRTEALLDRKPTRKSEETTCTLVP